MKGSVLVGFPQKQTLTLRFEDKYIIGDWGVVNGENREESGEMRKGRGHRRVHYPPATAVDKWGLILWRRREPL